MRQLLLPAPAAATIARGGETLMGGKEAEYVYPYAFDSRNMVDAWIDSGYINSVSDGQGLVALITPHGCLKWLEGDLVEYSRGVWVSNMWWHDRKIFGRIARHALI